MKFDKNYFNRQRFTQIELEKYYNSIRKNLTIAQSNPEPEIRFHFTYMALLKIGIYLLAKKGYRVKSRPGHHQKIIETLSEILNNEDIVIIGDKMRKDRNLDLYSADIDVPQKKLRPVEC